MPIYWNYCYRKPWFWPQEKGGHQETAGSPTPPPRGPLVVPWVIWGSPVRQVRPMLKPRPVTTKRQLCDGVTTKRLFALAFALVKHRPLSQLHRKLGIRMRNLSLKFQLTNSKFPEWACSLSWLFEESCSSQLLPEGPVDPAELA